MRANGLGGSVGTAAPRMYICASPAPFGHAHHSMPRHGRTRARCSPDPRCRHGRLQPRCDRRNVSLDVLLATRPTAVGRARDHQAVVEPAHVQVPLVRLHPCQRDRLLGFRHAAVHAVLKFAERQEGRVAETARGFLGRKREIVRFPLVKVRVLQAGLRLDPARQHVLLVALDDDLDVPLLLGRQAPRLHAEQGARALCARGEECPFCGPHGDLAQVGTTGRTRRRASSSRAASTRRVRTSSVGSWVDWSSTGTVRSKFATREPLVVVMASALVRGAKRPLCKSTSLTIYLRVTASDAIRQSSPGGLSTRPAQCASTVRDCRAASPSAVLTCDCAEC